MTTHNQSEMTDIQIKRDLQLLKGDDGQYVLSTLASVSALPKLVEYIASQKAIWEKAVLEARLDEADYHRHTVDSIIKGIRFVNNQTYYINRGIEVDTRIAKYEKQLAQLSTEEVKES